MRGRLPVEPSLLALRCLLPLLSGDALVARSFLHSSLPLVPGARRLTPAHWPIVLSPPPGVDIVNTYHRLLHTLAMVGRSSVISLFVISLSSVLSPQSVCLGVALAFLIGLQHPPVRSLCIF